MPTWNSTLNKYSRGETLTPVPSAARTTSANSGGLTAGFVSFDFLVTTTALTGGGTVTVTVEESSDNSSWTAVAGASSGAVSTIQAAARVRGIVVRQWYRIVWTVSGTSITFSVSGLVK